MNPLLRKLDGIGAVGGSIGAYCETRTPDFESWVYVLGRVNQSAAEAMDVIEVISSVMKRYRMDAKIVRISPLG